MTMREITEREETHAAVRRASVQTAKNYAVLSTIFKPIVKIGGKKVERRIHIISAFWAAVCCGRFSIDGKKYKLKASRDVFYIVAV